MDLFTLVLIIFALSNVISPLWIVRFMSVMLQPLWNHVVVHHIGIRDVILFQLILSESFKFFALVAAIWLNFPAFVLLAFLGLLFRSLSGLDVQEAIIARLDEGEHEDVSFEAVNHLLDFVWQTYGYKMSEKVLQEVWPILEAEIRTKLPHCIQVSLKKLYLGEQPPKITFISVDNFCGNGQDMAIDFNFSYFGNAHLDFVIFEDPPLRVPVSIHDMTASMKIRLVIKSLSPEFPFVQGVQFSFLETPIFDWRGTGIARITDWPIVEPIIDRIIDNKMQELTFPNRVCIPNKLKSGAEESMRKTGMEDDPEVTERIERISRRSIAGIVQLQVPSARNLSTSMSMANFNFKDQLMNVKIVVEGSLEGKVVRSSLSANPINPKWDFSASFPVEFIRNNFIKIKVISIFEKSEEELGYIEESVELIKSKKVIQGWYKFEKTSKGKIQVQFRWKRS